jgi:hypothetical protein
MADPQVPGYTSIYNTTGAFGLTVQNPTTLDQYTLVAAGGGGGGVATVTATNSSIVVAGTTSNPTIGRAALTGDVTAAAGSNATTVAAIQGTTIAAPPGGTTEFLRGDGTWAVPAGSGSGTVTSVSVVSANGLAGTVATPTSTPAITLSTSITGVLKGNGTAVSAATAGTDYLTPSGSGASLTGITAAQVGALAIANNLSDVADAGSSRFHLSLPVQSSVAAVAVANVNIASAPTTMDTSYTLLANDEVLLTAQTTTSQNGIYLFSAAGSALTRPNEFPSAGVVKRGRTCYVVNGTVYAGTTWALAATAAGLTIDTSPQVWTEVGGAASFGPTANVRKGAITPATGDYTAAQVTNAADKSSATTQTFSGIVSSSLGLATTGNISSGSLPSLGGSGLNWTDIIGTPPVINNSYQNATGRNITIGFKVNGTAGTSITAIFQMSPDNSTFTPVWEWQADLATTAPIIPFILMVPAGFYVEWTNVAGITSVTGSFYY